MYPITYKQEKPSLPTASLQQQGYNKSIQQQNNEKDMRNKMVKKLESQCAAFADRSMRDSLLDFAVGGKIGSYRLLLSEDFPKEKKLVVIFERPGTEEKGDKGTIDHVAIELIQNNDSDIFKYKEQEYDDIQKLIDANICSWFIDSTLKICDCLQKEKELLQKYPTENTQHEGSEILRIEKRLETVQAQLNGAKQSGIKFFVPLPKEVDCPTEEYAKSLLIPLADLQFERASKQQQPATENRCLLM